MPEFSTLKSDSFVSQGQGSICLGVLLLIRDDLHQHPRLPRRLRVTVAANVQRCSTHCVGPSCRLISMIVWATLSQRRRLTVALYPESGVGVPEAPADNAAAPDRAMC